jgi:hypothetical protein
MGSDALQATMEINARLRDDADRIYGLVFPGCVIDRNVPLVLDKEFGVDLILRLVTGAILTVQEKFRENKWLHCMEFTQEIENATGTQYQSDGEWYKFVANVYLYGWESENIGSFAKWAMLDVLHYKLIVEAAGGLHRLGTLQHNDKYGKASFYAIPIMKLANCFIADYRKFK